MFSRRPTRGPGIRMRLLVANSVVVIAGIATTSVVAAIVGPPMFRRLMDKAVVPGLDGNHPYERAFRDATALSVGIALGVSALAALTLSWYLSRRVHHSATALSQAASAVSKGQYDIRVPPPRLGKEFDAVAEAFNKMAQQLGVVDDTRRQMLADLAHEIRTPVAVLDAYMEALEDGVQRLDRDTIGTLRDQTRRLTRFSLDVNALSVAERRTTSVDARWISPKALIDTAVAAFRSPLQRERRGPDFTHRRRSARVVGRPRTARTSVGQSARQCVTPHRSRRWCQRYRLCRGRRAGDRDLGHRRRGGP